MNKKAYGFTIVELLIVIVVIGILAAISIVAYNNIQQRARDSIRTNDISNIIKALALYRTEHDGYPMSHGPSGPGGWEISNNLAAGRTFMQNLTQVSGSKMPVDPTNSGAYRYEYIHIAGTWSFPNGCTTGESFYVLRVTYESANNSDIPAGTPAATCGGHNGWVSTATVKYIGPSHALK